MGRFLIKSIMTMKLRFVMARVGTDLNETCKIAAVFIAICGTRFRQDKVFSTAMPRRMPSRQVGTSRSGATEPALAVRTSRRPSP
jgi:hypothetical protein